MIVETIPQRQDRSAEENLIPVRELWYELAAEKDASPPREAHLKLLHERLERYRQHPQDTVAWEDVKALILASR